VFDLNRERRPAFLWWRFTGALVARHGRLTPFALQGYGTLKGKGGNLRSWITSEYGVILVLFSVCHFFQEAIASGLALGADLERVKGIEPSC
jgi:hypothetical protein